MILLWKSIEEDLLIIFSHLLLDITNDCDQKKLPLPKESVLRDGKSIISTIVRKHKPVILNCDKPF